MLAVNTFISEVNLFAAKKCAMIFLQVGAFLLVNDEVAEICMHI